MATNFFFNNFQASQEQLLLENLIIESIKIYGHDVFYIPRKLNNYDDVYGADDQSSYEVAYPIEMYIKSVDGFGGDGDFLSKFGVEIRNQVVFSMAQRVFSEEVGEFTTQVRPNEGDLIYFPLNKKCFQIRYVNKFEMFYQLGALQTWEVTCELFEYSGEILNTGIDEIDILQTKFDTNALSWALTDQVEAKITDQEGNLITVENSSLDDLIPASDNDEIQRESDLFVDFSAMDPFSEGKI
jgi:signal peptidase I